MPQPFVPQTDKEQTEFGDQLSVKFNDQGMVPCISTHADTGEVLMLGYMNDVALAKTIETGFVYYWSRTRGKLWFKGESSGMTQQIDQLLTNCDQSALVAKVRIGKSHTGGVQASCHTGYPNCFYREVQTGKLPPDGRGAKLTVIQDKAFDPDKVYGKSH